MVIKFYDSNAKAKKVIQAESAALRKITVEVESAMEALEKAEEALEETWVESERPLQDALPVKIDGPKQIDIYLLITTDKNNENLIWATLNYPRLYIDGRYEEWE